MKLKEYFPSFIKGLKLRLTPVSKIKKEAEHSVPVIVSLTTIPTRLNIVKTTIRSLLNTSPQPEKIILWLNDDLKNDIPYSLKILEGDVFEIRYSPYTFSHRKLIHSLNAFPDKIIITVDDDVMYEPELIGLLYKSHLKYPNDIIANRVRKISYHDSGYVLPYVNWPHVVADSEPDEAMMPVGVCGVLYPPKSLDQRVTNVDLFIEISPKSDDLWFKAMSLINNTSSRFAPFKVKDPTPIINSQKVSLKKINVKKDYNRIQWENLAEEFDLKKRIYN